jgi:hypothetical protein
MGLKTASFTLHATMAQSIAWKRAAEAEGFASVGGWATLALDAYLKARARAGRPIPLAWRRGRFRVRLDSGETVSLAGHISPPLSKFHTLIFQPDGRLIATVRTYRQAQALASELAPVLLQGELPDPAPIIDRHQRESV